MTLIENFTRLCLACLAVFLMAGCRGGADTSTEWPEWQRIEAVAPPSAWRVEEASAAFDAWEASAFVAELTFAPDATTIRFADDGGREVEVRLTALPVERFPPAMVEGDAVRVVLIRRQGFEGVAQGLAVYDQADRLLLLYDDGGYGAAFYEADARGGLTVERDLSGADRREGWMSRDVTFEVEGQSLVLAEGRTAPLGNTGLAVTVVVSREWTGPPMTDADLSPLAYVVFRTGGP